MTINLIFCKDKGDSNIGYVYVNFKETKQPNKRVSTKIKISKSDFDDHKNKYNPIFNATPTFEYQKLNDVILEITSNNPFATSKYDFVKFFGEKLHLQENGGSKKSYKTIYNRLKTHYPTLDFNKIDNKFLMAYKNILKTPRILENGTVRKGLSDGTICHTFTVLGSYFTLANEIVPDCKIVFNLSKLGLKKSKKRNLNLLSDDDVNKLLSVPISHKNYEYTTFGLFQLFGNGLRFSDLILLKNGYFIKDGIQIQLPKTKEVVMIPYSTMLLRVLYRFVFKDSQFTEIELSNILQFNLGNNNKIMEILKNDILTKISKSDPNSFFFSFTPIALINYDASNSFNDEEFRLISNSRGCYASKLRIMRGKNHLDLTIPSLSTHSFRYKFVSDCIEMKIPIYEISKSLFHSSISITELYIKKHFGVDDSKNVSNVIDLKYLGNPT